MSSLLFSFCSQMRMADWVASCWIFMDFHQKLTQIGDWLRSFQWINYHPWALGVPRKPVETAQGCHGNLEEAWLSKTERVVPEWISATLATSAFFWEIFLPNRWSQLDTKTPEKAASKKPGSTWPTSLGSWCQEPRARPINIINGKRSTTIWIFALPCNRNSKNHIWGDPRQELYQ